MTWRRNGAIDLQTAVTLLAAWLTSIVFSAANGHGPLLIAASMFPPIGVVHGVGVWFGGW
jgi:hypothetical protein